MDQWLTSIMDGVISGVLIFVTAITNNYLRQHNMRQISASTLNLFEKAAETQAGAWVAAQLPGWEKAVVPSNDQWIVNEAEAILVNLAAEPFIGMTPVKLQKMIAGGIGNLQALALSGGPPVVVQQGAKI